VLIHPGKISRFTVKGAPNFLRSLLSVSVHLPNGIKDAEIPNEEQAHILSVNTVEAYRSLAFGLSLWLTLKKVTWFCRPLDQNRSVNLKPLLLQWLMSLNKQKAATIRPTSTAVVRQMLVIVLISLLFIVKVVLTNRLFVILYPLFLVAFHVVNI
jgi:hypothetical protein